MGTLYRVGEKVWDRIGGDALWHVVTEVKRYFLGPWGVSDVIRFSIGIAVATLGAIQVWISTQPLYVVFLVALLILCGMGFFLACLTVTARATKASQQAASPPALSPAPTSSLFEIEPTKWELHWRDAGKSSLVPFTPDPDGQPPDSATVVLAIETKITAIPAQHLEDMQLSIMSQLLSPSLNSWYSKEISGGRPCLFYFDIPPSLSHGPHFVHLVATSSLHGIIHQRPSPPFEIVLARTYQQLHRFRPQQFPLPS